MNAQTIVKCRNCGTLTEVVLRVETGDGGRFSEIWPVIERAQFAMMQADMALAAALASAKAAK